MNRIGELTAKFYTFFFSWGYFYFSAGYFAVNKKQKSLSTYVSDFIYL